MKYAHYSEEDFIKDEYFQNWVLNNDPMADNFWKNWMKDHPEKEAAVEKARRFIVLMHYDQDELSTQDFDAMWRNIVERREDTASMIGNQKTISKLKNLAWLRVAAIFIGLIATGVGIYFVKPFASIETSLPSDSQITLQLEDGSIKILEESTSGTIKNGEGKTILTQLQSTISYREGNSTTKTLKYNQLSVPYGKKFELILSDGSHIFLNSGSNLRYPVRFLDGEPRNVYLNGEAYFSVQKDSGTPFTVITDDMNTQVYGTEFNVSSYKNENNTSTVLVEGSVGVYRSNNEEAIGPIMIEPGQRAIFENNSIGVEETDVSKYIAWKDNKLLFVNDRFDLILKELERHFNVEIENYFLELNDKKITGTFEKEPLTKILKICQEHTPFDYEIDGDKITITKINQEMK
ncbi:FecR domain-containing protein [Flagellimonas sp. 389]|uniref:FecR family protein n=1 Tax=Flagellimonas sp. 389 TaxID=2835862 RepID=UPI001BD5EF08|nr:FecR domain-containing protein [Flagellimonas sp. 389]MBS9462887.1 FecR domain-containing protein [Flagellimonas sp. 389]